MSGLRSHLTYANVGVTLALLLAASGFAVASIPGGGGVISACYQRHGGNLRVIDTAKHGTAGKCTRGEKLLTWNRQGQRGLPGIQGGPGNTGLTGQPGPSVGNFAICPDSMPTAMTTGMAISQVMQNSCTTTLTAPTAGKVLVTASAEVGMASLPTGCSPNGTARQTIVVGGSGSKQSYDEVKEGLDLSRTIGLSYAANVGAGPVTISYYIELGYGQGTDCTTGQIISFGFQSQSTNAVFVKGPS